jgi:hypothetical protein
MYISTSLEITNADLELLFYSALDTAFTNKLVS